MRRYREKGFSLIEFLVYSGVLAIVVAIISGVFIYLTRGTGQTDARTVVNSNMRLAFERIEQDVKDANGITTPSIGLSSNKLIISFASDQITYDISAGRIRRQVNSSTPIYITSAQAEVTALTFTQFQNINVPANSIMVSVRTAITARYNSDQSSQNFTQTRSKTALINAFFPIVRSIFGAHGGGGGDDDGCIGYKRPNFVKSARAVVNAPICPDQQESTLLPPI